MEHARLFEDLPASSQSTLMLPLHAACFAAFLWPHRHANLVVPCSWSKESGIGKGKGEKKAGRAIFSLGLWLVLLPSQVGISSLAAATEAAHAGVLKLFGWLLRSAAAFAWVFVTMSVFLAAAAIVGFITPGGDYCFPVGAVALSNVCSFSSAAPKEGLITIEGTFKCLVADCTFLVVLVIPSAVRWPSATASVVWDPGGILAMVSSMLWLLGRDLEASQRVDVGGRSAKTNQPVSRSLQRWTGGLWSFKSGRACFSRSCVLTLLVVFMLHLVGATSRGVANS